MHVSFDNPDIQVNVQVVEYLDELIGKFKQYEKLVFCTVITI